MSINGLKIGIGLTGSFCTFEKTFQLLEQLKEEGAIVTTVFSPLSQTVKCRFGNGEDFLKHAYEITEKAPITTIAGAEPIGPKHMFDIFILLPCTGNSLAKLANGIVDTPVLMAAKSHLRNGSPLLISVSTNDALSMNFKNIGLLMNMKHIFFVPFAQDNPDAKPNSLIADYDMLIPSIKAALEHRQLQPVLAQKTERK
ncbi:MAG: dipicolinate synthase subunit B [Lachnospiraceae bacterium]|nr:dipicolinate synthase subunit B [Lachnospiraceae bacterium]